MNDIFDINRFVNLQKRNFLISKRYLIYLSASLAGLMLVLSVASILDPINCTWLINPACYAIILLCPTFFESKTNSNDAIFEFTLPVSTFERFLIMITNYIIVIPVLSLITVVVSRFLIVSLFSIIPIDRVQASTDLASLEIAFMPYVKLMAAQSFVVVCSVFFKNRKLAKTILTLIGVVFLMQTISGVAAYIIILNNGMNETAMTVNNIVFSDYQFAKYADQPVVQAIKYLFMAFPLGMWLVSFLKLREKEI